MLLTPRIVRTHELTAQDLAPIYIGTQQNIGLTGPPPLIAPPPGEEPPAPGAEPEAPPAPPPPAATLPGATPRAGRADAACRRRPRRADVASGGPGWSAADPPTSPTGGAPARRDDGAARRGSGASPIPGTTTAPAQPATPTRRPLRPGPGTPAPVAAGPAPRPSPVPAPAPAPAPPVEAPSAAARAGACSPPPAPSSGWAAVPTPCRSRSPTRRASRPSACRCPSTPRCCGCGRSRRAVSCARAASPWPSRSRWMPRPGASTSTMTRTGDQAGASGAGLLAAVLFEPVAAGTVDAVALGRGDRRRRARPSR